MGTESESIYSKIGGADAVTGVVDVFYDRMLGDPRVRDYFSQTDMQVQRWHMAVFITMALGGPAFYKGRDMKAAHMGLNIDNTAFDATVENLVSTLTEWGIPKKHIATLGETLAPMRGDIVERD